MANLNEQFGEFLKANAVATPPSYDKSLHQLVAKDLKRVRTNLIGRALGLHVIAAAATLVFCPQFGLGPLGGLSGVFGFFMEQGPMICALFCGAFYMGVTGLTLGVGLSKPGLLMLAQHPAKYLSALSVASMLALMSVDTALNGSWPSFDGEFLLFWFLGAILCSTFGFQAVARIRARPWHIAMN
jgi:hypothetical protein